MRPVARKGLTKAVKREDGPVVPITNRHKVRSLRAFVKWQKALEDNPKADLKTYAREEGVRVSSIWAHLRKDDKLAEQFVQAIMGTASQGLAMAMQRGVEILQLDGVDEEGANDTSILREQRAWAELFAKYVHGAFKKSEGGKDGSTVNVNIGIPAHIQHNLGINDERVLDADFTLKTEMGDLLGD